MKNSVICEEGTHCWSILTVTSYNVPTKAEQGFGLETVTVSETTWVCNHCPATQRERTTIRSVETTELVQ